jgi:uncharacterized repeat protein (TIGR03803 family)
LETVLYSFSGGADGAYPSAGVVADDDGNLYGTTMAGGAIGKCGFGDGCGVVFRLSAKNQFTILHKFGGADGFLPFLGELVLDRQGNLYGTTIYGGTAKGCGEFGLGGCGVVFKIAPNGTETVLHNFTGVNDGSNPEAGLLLDASGTLYGVAAGGGALGRCGGPGCGVAFSLGSNGSETILYSFNGNKATGYGPGGRMVRDDRGNFYGTAVDGGTKGFGTIFRLSQDTQGSWTETIFYDIPGTPSARSPSNGLTMDPAGNLFGTSDTGGTYDAGCVFELAR